MGFLGWLGRNIIGSLRKKIKHKVADFFAAAKLPAMQLDELIDRRGLPIGELAALAGISKKGLYDLRAGRVRKARPSTVAGLAHALNVSTKRLRSILASGK